MSTNDYMIYRTKVIHYKSNYDKDGDDSRYASNCVVAALKLWADENNETMKRMGKAGVVLPAALSVSSPLFMAAMDTVAHAIHCPVDKEMSAAEYLKHFAKQVGSRYNSEYAEPVRKALKAVGDGLRSLGFAA